MGRRLPWKRIETSESSNDDKGRCEDDDATESSSSKSSASPSRRGGRERRSRTRSGLPPRAERMRTGDTRFRLVEDEFLATAQRFTTHLHRAEYARHKARVVVAPYERVQRGRVELDRPWMGTSLHGLMETPLAERTSPGPEVGARVASVSGAAGARHQVSSVPEVHGRVAAPVASRRAAEVRIRRPVEGGTQRPAEMRNQRPADVGTQRAKETGIRREAAPALDVSPDAPTESDDDDDDADDPFGIFKRRAQRLKAKEQLQQQRRKETTRNQQSLRGIMSPSA